MSKMTRLAAAIPLLAYTALAARQKSSSPKVLSPAQPIQSYKQDCGLQRPISMIEIPGAGMEPSKLTPFAKVLKDGYHQVECVKDYMYEYGDKFGDNKFSYKLGPVSNVSIVHYDSHVPREDRKPMTHATCFAFCRTVPDMLFFGITNGRHCYCEPYYKPMASDDSTCDAVCEGETTTICGSKTKSTVFSMHSCDDLGTEFTSTMTSMAQAEGMLKAYIGTAEGKLTYTTQTFEDIQKKFGNVGDMVVTEQMQAAKGMAIDLAKAIGAANKTSAAIADLKAKGAAYSLPTSDAKVVAEVEAWMHSSVTATATANEIISKFDALVEKMVEEDTSASALAQYYPVTYYLGMKKNATMSTCGGKIDGAVLGKNRSSCAVACNARVGTCVGFQHHAAQASDLCILFSKLESATYYTKCGADASQKAADIQCMGKLQFFEGTTLKPDPSGKCERCLEKVTKADRCV